MTTPTAYKTLQVDYSGMVYYLGREVLNGQSRVTLDTNKTTGCQWVITSSAPKTLPSGDLVSYANIVDPSGQYQLHLQDQDQRYYGTELPLWYKQNNGLMPWQIITRGDKLALSYLDGGWVVDIPSYRPPLIDRPAIMASKTNSAFGFYLQIGTY